MLFACTCTVSEGREMLWRESLLREKLWNEMNCGKKECLSLLFHMDIKLQKKLREGGEKGWCLGRKETDAGTRGGEEACWSFISLFDVSSCKRLKERKACW